MEGGNLLTQLKQKVIPKVTPKLTPSEQTKNKILNYNIATHDFISKLEEKNLIPHDKNQLTNIRKALSSIINGTLLYYDLIAYVENIINTENDKEIITEKEAYINIINEIDTNPYSEPTFDESKYAEFPKEVVEIRNKVKTENELSAEQDRENAKILAQEAAAKVQEKAAAEKAAAEKAAAEAAAPTAPPTPTPQTPTPPAAAATLPAVPPAPPPAAAAITDCIVGKLEGNCQTAHQDNNGHSSHPCRNGNICYSMDGKANKTLMSYNPQNERYKFPNEIPPPAPAEAQPASAEPAAPAEPAPPPPGATQQPSPPKEPAPREQSPRRRASAAAVGKPLDVMSSIAEGGAAATKIQSLYRGKEGRKKANKIRELEKQLEDTYNKDDGDGTGMTKANKITRKNKTQKNKLKKKRVSFKKN